MHGALNALALAKTLTANPELAQLVRKLELTATSCHMDECIAHVEILGACEHATSVTIYGYNEHGPQLFRDVLRGLKDLKSLEISRYSSAFISSTTQC